MIVIAETASAESGGSKAEWARALFGFLAAQPDVAAVIWFNFLKAVSYTHLTLPTNREV